MALSVPNEPGSEEDSEQTPEEVLSRLGFPFDSGRATVELLDVLQQIHNVVYDHYRPLPIPTSLLIDGQGRLAALYKGPVSVERILQDVQSVQWDAQRQSSWDALPFAGPWVATPGPHRVGLLAARLWQGNYDRAALELTDRLNARGYETQQIKARLTAAVWLQKRGDAQRASEQIHAVLQTTPDEPDANFQMGTLLADQGKLLAAIECFQKTLLQTPSPRADAHANLGAALRKLGRMEEAIVQLRAAVELDPNMVAAHVNLGLLLAAQRDFDEAAESFQRAVELEPTNETHQVNLAMAWVNAGKPELARQQLVALVRANPQLPTGRIYLSEVLVRLDRIDEAIDQLQEVVKTQPDASRIWMRLAELYEQNHRERAALEAYRQAERLLDGDPRVQTRIAWILATSSEPSLRDGAEALRLADEAARRTQRSQPEVLDTLAAAFARLGRFDEAVQTARQAMAILTAPGSQGKRQAIQARIEDYRQSKPYTAMP